ncbi:hypothetical protein Sala_2106 [Sphingopyxis alaskensis RB2256]|uniref:Uncharacterized protein n=2 Tax=Sphingopyxis alaskensis TaxID=117207 RepID=Q1GRA7_SPHAL|nr:hypothetical protein Sala_2106 [Sphingopyxis alaskensis RB2256]
MARRPACRECFTRFAAAFALSCVMPVTAGAQMQGPPAPPPPRDAESAVANAKELVDPIRRCKPTEDGTINVCGTDTERHRLTPELRAIAQEGREAPPKLPRAEARAMSLDKLPYNWISIGGRMKPGPEYNALYEMAKERTDPETGTPPPLEEP